MRNMNIGHQQIVITNNCCSDIGTCGTMDGDKLSYRVEVSNNYPFFLRRTSILRRCTDEQN